MDVKLAPLNQAAILARLHNQTIVVPDLKRLFATWPAVETNPHYRAIVPLVNQAIDRISAHQPLLAKRKKDDIALLTALWFPQAEKHVLETLALYAVWLVCWDDAVDGNEGDLSANFEKAESWRETTVDIIRAKLRIRLGGEPEGEEGEEDDTDDVNIILRDFGERFVGTAPVIQRQRLFTEMHAFINECSIEQQLRIGGQVPDYDWYMNMRRGTVAGSTLCSLVEYAIQEELPTSVNDSTHRQKLWEQVCIILALINDLLSLKKEVASGCVINAVAALLSSKKDLSDVVIEVEEKLEKAVEEFEQSAVGLLGLEVVKEDEMLNGVVTRYIDGCRAIVTGTLEFTLKSPRYKLSQLIQEDGTLSITL